MKILGGLLGILGALLGLFVFLYQFMLIAEFDPDAPSQASVVAGSVATAFCAVFGIAILLGARWLAGALLLTAGLTAMFLSASWLLTPAVVGGGLAIIHGGYRRPRPEEIQRRLELEIQQRFGGRRQA
jgi:hypothetical protein